MKPLKWLLLLLCIPFLCFSAMLAPSYAARQSESTINAAPAKVTALAEHTVNELSQNPEFENFRNASLHIMPLGPGTHSYLIHVIQQKNEIIGYVIITAKSSDAEKSVPEQTEYVVTEYGAGLSSFDPAILSVTGHLPENFSVTSDAVQMKYTGGLSYWVIKNADKIVYIDAGNGDVLLGDPESLSPPPSEESTDLLGSNYTLHTLRNTATAFDPSENIQWRTSLPVTVLSQGAILKKLEASDELMFSSSKYNMWYSGPLAISGYAVWTSSDDKIASYVRISSGESQVRYVPVNRLFGNGHFYEHTP